jgi:hypothetical protein
MQTPSRAPARCAALMLAAAVAAQPLPEQSARIASYTMQVELLPRERELRGRQEIAWTNATRGATDELRFHLYLNAFRDRRSTFMREANQSFRRQWREGEFGGIAVTRIELVRDAGPVDLTAQAAFVQPDDGNADDATVLRVPLPAAVGPGASVVLRTEFTARLPKAYRRTGWIPDDGFFCMHWFPKLGVLQDGPDGSVWSCHQFHANTEFFADFGVYDVAITLPRGFVVGATGGVPVEERDLGDGRKTLRFRQPDVHDFAWVADPDFIVHEDEFGPVAAASDPVAREVAAELGVAVAQFDLPRTRIRLLLRPEHAGQRDRHLEAVRCGLQFFGLRYGPYPYAVITAVDPGRDIVGRGLGGGMEYPTLITCGTSLFPHPRRMSPEGVTVHEFGHQYWYGLSANNEFTESWLDEGINTYSEGRAQWLHYFAAQRPALTVEFGVLQLAGSLVETSPPSGPGLSLRLPYLDRLPAPVPARLGELGVRGTLLPASPLLDLMRLQPMATAFREVAFEDSWNDRARMLSVDNPDAMVRPGWTYLDGSGYGVNSYQRPATLLTTLERLVGRRQWWAFLRLFHARARLAHPTTDDFVALLRESCGPEAADYFERASRPGAVLDYGIHAVRPFDGRGPVKTVIVRRWGTLTADVRVRFRFAGRAEPQWRELRAEDLQPWWTFTFDDAADGQPWGRLLEVWVDPPAGTPATGEPFEAGSGPGGVHLLDANLLNNAWRAQPDHGPGLYRGIRLLLQTQSQLVFAGLAG